MSSDHESTVIGVLLDVSGSMKSSIQQERHRIEKEKSDKGWIRSIFEVLDSLIKDEVPDNKHSIFAIGFGGIETQIFDLLTELDKHQPNNETDNRDTDTILLEILDILHKKGAWNLLAWVSLETLKEAIPRDEAIEIVNILLKNEGDICSKVVNEFLPDACRNPVYNVGLIVENRVKDAYNDFRRFSNISLNMIKSRCASVPGVRHIVESRRASVADVREVIEKGIAYVYSKRYKTLTKPTANSIMDVHTASKILRASAGNKKELTREHIDKFLNRVEPYIYGGTPLNEALNKAVKLFKTAKASKKLLFVLSDGSPADPDVHTPLEDLQSCLLYTSPSPRDS